MNENELQVYASSSIILSKALSYILKNGEGVVIELDENQIIDDLTKKVVVFKNDDTISISKTKEDLPSGTFVSVSLTS
jgi:hypothetical protein